MTGRPVFCLEQLSGALVAFEAVLDQHAEISQRMASTLVGMECLKSVEEVLESSFQDLPQDNPISTWLADLRNVKPPNLSDLESDPFWGFSYREPYANFLGEYFGVVSKIIKSLQKLHGNLKIQEA